jgi:hypothetical protein
MPIVGTLVVIEGIVSQPELNGRHGRVERSQTRPGRCVVRVDASPLNLAEANLCPALEEKVEICPICMDCPNDQVEGKHNPGLCGECGGKFCASCWQALSHMQDYKCPMCRKDLLYASSSNKALMEAMLKREVGPHTTIAQFQLGLIAFQAGDVIAAKKWYGLSAWRNNPTAMYNLGQLCIASGIDDRSEASMQVGIRWHERASKIGYHQSQTILAVLHFHGLHKGTLVPTEKDLARARQYTHLAMQDTSAHAMQTISDCLTDAFAGELIAGPRARKIQDDLSKGGFGYQTY